ncbi:peroxide stress protein YaaA [Methanothermococcus sp. Ax23]|uniref:peroxide stress protein YaaA n=1 Tax=Methanothermococcus sp. Ax23 TaxID=3156486 RepID=UPI003BA31942
MGKKYLLILSCSKTKKNIDRAPAIELYDGMYYRVLRKNFNLKDNKNLDILILSAKYGLIDSNEIIDYYDQLMTSKRAEELKDSVKSKLKEVLKNNNYDEIFITMGATYEKAFDSECRELLQKYNTHWIEGMIGERLQQLKKWLISINNDK